VTLGNDQIKFGGTASDSSGATAPSATPVAVTGHDSFAFHSNIGDGAAHNSATNPVDVLHDGNHSSQLVASLFTSAPAETGFDPVHDAADALTNQFHQTVTNVSHLH